MSNDDTTDRPNRRPTTRRRILRTGAGAGAAALALPVVSGTAAAHFPDELDVVVSPAREFMRHRNPGHEHVLDAASNVVAVWVLPNESFDPLDAGVHYRFGAPEVVDAGDGVRPTASYVGMDHADERLLLTFPMQGTGFEGDECTAKLAWERHRGAGHGLSGTAPIRVQDGRLETPDAATCEARRAEEGTDSHGDD